MNCRTCCSVCFEEKNPPRKVRLTRLIDTRRCAMNFDLNSQARHELGSRLIDVVDNYFGSLPDRPVQVAAEQRVHAQRLSRIPETGDDAVKVFDGLCRELIDSGFHIPSAHYLGM